MNRLPNEQRILRRPQVEALIGLRKSTLYKLIKDGQFPAPIKITKRAVGWRSVDIDQWLQSLPDRAHRDK